MQSTKKTLLQANNITFKYENSEDYLFKDISFALKTNNKIGLIGKNGSGKSTLLKLLSKSLVPEKGTIISNTGVEYVSQTLPTQHQQIENTVSEMLTEDHFDLWEVISILKSLFRWEIDLNAKVKNLSGGEFTKLKIAQALSKQPQVLLLDEPTNHIDLSAIKNLAKFLNNFKGAFIVVSHNISFLNSVTKTTWEINEDTKNINTYGGNYDFFISQRKNEEQIRELKLSQAKKERKRILQTRDQMAKTKANREKSGKKKLENRRILKDQYNMMISSAEGYYGRRNIEIERQLEKASEDIEENRNTTEKSAYMKINTTNDSKKTLVNIEHADLTIQKQRLIGDFSFTVIHGDRIAILGDNGTGKTTLAKGILNLIDSPKSNIAQINGKHYISKDISTIYLDQKYEIVNPKLTVLENMMKASPSTTTSYSKAQLGKYLFKSEAELVKKSSTLSGGETARLALAMISVTSANLLILDEPANNLDINTIQVFEDTLNRYTGAIIVISHDESFINKINIEKHYKIKNKKLIKQ